MSPKKFRKFVLVLFVAFFVVPFLFSGCATKSKSVPKISTLALLSQDSDLYIAVPVKYHKNLVSDLISSETGLSKKDAATIAGRISVLYGGIGNSVDSGRLELAAEGSFPSVAVDIALNKNDGWIKKNYTAKSNPEALAYGYPNDFKYYQNGGLEYKVSFPTSKELLVSKRILPLLENYAVRYDASVLPYNDFVNFEVNTTQDILFYSENPVRLVSSVLGDFASNWFVAAHGKLSKKSESEYKLTCSLSLADKNRKTIVMSLLAIGGIPVREIDSTTIEISDIVLAESKIKDLL